MRYLSQIFQFKIPLHRQQWSALQDWVSNLSKRFLVFLDRVKLNGAQEAMTREERSKLGIFNHLNFFQLLTGILVPLAGLILGGTFPFKVWLVASLPAFISVVVLLLNFRGNYKVALMAYFMFYPLFTCLAYINGVNMGVELTFILYGILAVFFIKDIGYMLFAISFSMVSYFILSVVWKSYPYQLEAANFTLYLINQVLAIIYIFYGLYLIKFENARVTASLQRNNEEKQKQAEELESLNALKNNLFSVISHDLKSPLYALRNLFENIHQQDMPAEEIKEMIPDVKNDLNYTVALMENLLQWAKSQMQAHVVRPQLRSIRDISESVVAVLHRQAAAKKIKVENLSDPRCNVWADEDMTSLVLRNILSNAIKFTPIGGTITISTEVYEFYIRTSIKDTGRGISKENIEKINASEFYTTTGTAQEQGTGLGLMLCKEFLSRNDGKLTIESMEGKGSIFSFTLPKG